MNTELDRITGELAKEKEKVGRYEAALREIIEKHKTVGHIKQLQKRYYEILEFVYETLKVEK